MQDMSSARISPLGLNKSYSCLGVRMHIIVLRMLYSSLGQFFLLEYNLSLFLKVVPLDHGGS